jgi:hypothetical protein
MTAMFLSQHCHRKRTGGPRIDLIDRQVIGDRYWTSLGCLNKDREIG